MGQRLPILARLSQKERLLPVDGDYTGIDFVDVEDESAIRKLLRYLTCNGALLPAFLMKQGTVFQQKALKAVFKETFGYREIYYEHSPSMTGYTASYDRKEFFATNWQFARCLVKLLVNYSALQRRYQQRTPELMTRDFWKRVYGSEAE